MKIEDYKPGMIVYGKITGIQAYGAFVSFAGDVKGLIHISKLADRRVGKVEDVVKLGDEVTVKVIKVDQRDGKIDLSMRPSDINSDKLPTDIDDRRDRRDRGERRGRNFGYGRGDRDRDRVRREERESREDRDYDNED